MQASIFDFGITVPKFWSLCDKAILDNYSHLVEHEFLTQHKQSVKTQLLVLSHDCLFKIGLNHLKMAPLQTMHVQYIDPLAEHFVQLMSDQQLFGFRLTFKGQKLEIFTPDKIQYDQWKQHFRVCCIFGNFHDAFSVTKMIGKGSFAKVYVALKKETNTTYAIKAFSKSYMSQQTKGIESLLNEIQMMRKLNHPNIVKLYEVHETVNSIYFVIDLIEGGELLNRVRETGFLPTLTMQKLAFNLISALKHMHDNHIMHRDLKPENLLLKTANNDYEIVLADFGLAASLEEEPLFKRCGTPGFVAPEILDYIDGQNLYGDKCDVFSAGVILYLLITGNTPFTGLDQKSILRNNKRCEIDFDEEHFKKAPIQLQDLIKSMLQKKSSYRLNSEECMRHPYFKELLKEHNIQQESLQLNLQGYQDFKNAIRMGTQEFDLRSPLGFNSSSESLSSNLSYGRQEQRKTSIALSKFSQYSAKLSKSNSREIGDIPLKPESKKQIDLHRLALTNSQLKNNNSNIFDNIEDPSAENCNLSHMVKQYNSTRQIRIPDEIKIKDCGTPTLK